MSTPSRAAVMAHYDPRGEIGPHVRRQARAVAQAVDEVVFVSTAPLTEASRTWFRGLGRLVERPNYGYDFFSYRTGLEELAPLGRFEEVVVCNDTYVGPLRPYEQIFSEMAPRRVDFWGLTACDRIGPHLQSFFVAFRPWVVESRAFTTFWSGMTPISDRSRVINRYEVGLSTALTGAGFSCAPYFSETDAERRTARKRMLWWSAHREDFPADQRHTAWVNEQSKAPWNPVIALADSALDAGRLPLVKIDTLRYDPYALNSTRLLTLAEKRFPEGFEGVREFLAETSRFYPPRKIGSLRPTPPALAPLRPLVEYHDAA